MLGYSQRKRQTLGVLMVEVIGLGDQLNVKMSLKGIDLQSIQLSKLETVCKNGGVWVETC